MSAEHELRSARLVRSVWLSERTRHLEFVTADGLPLDFQPGQFVSVKHLHEGRELTRAYSMANAPRGATFDLCLNRIDDGVLSNYLCDLPPGSEIRFHGPHGLFLLRRPLRDTLFIANGTGVAPIRSMLQSIFAGGAPPDGHQSWLVYGTRHNADIYYQDEFLQLASQFPNFHYVVTLSRPAAGWTGLCGWVQDHVANLARDRRDMDAYICGLKDMVKANRELLKELGWEKQSIVYERFD